MSRAWLNITKEHLNKKPNRKQEEKHWSNFKAVSNPKGLSKKRGVNEPKAIDQQAEDSKATEGCRD